MSTKSVFLYGKPTKKKLDFFLNTQKEYVKLINLFIEKMSEDRSFYLDLLNNNNQSPLVRNFEKEIRKTHLLGSAFGQNAIDHAVKELHNHFIRIRNNVYGYIQTYYPEMEDYISYISLLNCSLCDKDELDTLKLIIDHQKEVKKPNKKKIDEHEKLCQKIEKMSVENRNDCKEYVANLFYEKLNSWKLPQVKNTPLQLDGRLGKIELSHSTKKDFVVSFKVLDDKDYISIPVSTSKNSLRRLHQYKERLFKTGKTTFNVSFKRNKMKITIPFDKTIDKKKIDKKKLLAIDLGITDLIYTNQNNHYGTFTGMSKLYEELVETKLGNRSSLRNKMREYQKQLKKETNQNQKEILRKKIFHISSNLNNKKSLQKQRNRYNHEVDKRLNQAVKSCYQDLLKGYTLVHEDLDIAEFDKSKKENKRNSSWVRGKLINKLTEMCNWKGIPIIPVDPAYTSKVCPHCSNIDNDNRNNKKFVCTVCKHTLDADYNATINIEKRAFDKEIFEIVEKYKYSVKKRHQAIKDLYKKRHEDWLKKNKKVTVAI